MAIPDAWYNEIHKGHKIIYYTVFRKNGIPYRRCITCTHKNEYIDDSVIVRAIRGERGLSFNYHEMREVVKKLSPKESAREISEILGCTERTVFRIRAELRKPR